jgi:GT2 family glycosyltransferase
MRESIIGNFCKSAVHIFAVVVVYRMRPHESSTLQTLLRAAQNTTEDRVKLEVLVWDNTPGGQAPGEIPAGVRYRSAPENPGLAYAYNYALQIAYELGYEWLLTLDQDSVLPPNFLARIAEVASELNGDEEVGAIVPQVQGDKRNLSPFRFWFGAIPYWFSYGFVGKPREATYALNSAATFRIPALHQIGGYDPLFPIDVSDINLFHRLYRSGYRVFVAGDLLISHEFSLLKKHQRMSIERYRSQLWDECAFWDMNMGSLARMERLVRLIVRVCKDCLSPENHEFRNEAIREIRRRVLNRRSYRIFSWKSWATRRSIGGALFTNSTNVVYYEDTKVSSENSNSMGQPGSDTFSGKILGDRKRVQ